MDKQHENGQALSGTPLSRLVNATPEGGMTNVFIGDLRDVCSLIESPESTKLEGMAATGRAGTEIQVPTKDLRKMLDAILGPPAPAPAAEEAKTEETAESAEPDKKKK